jgi:RND family efflux transporter MFP subunit
MKNSYHQKKDMNFATKIILAISAIAVLLFGALLAGYLLTPKTPLPETFSATRGSVIQEILVRGKIRSSKKIELSFKYDGKVQSISVKEGDRVKKDQELARLDLSALETQRQELENSVVIAQAKLDNATKGPQKDLIVAAQRKKEEMTTALENATAALKAQNEKFRELIATRSDDVRKALISAHYYSGNAHTTFGGLFEESGYLKTELSSETSQHKDVLEKDLKNESVLLASASLSLETLQETLSEQMLDTAYTNSMLLLESQKLYLEHAAKMLQEATVSVSLSETTLNTYSTNIATARLNIVTSISDSILVMRALDDAKKEQTALIAELEKKLEEANSLLLAANNELLAIQTPIPESEKAALQAEREKLRAQLDFIKNHIKGSILYSPADAIIYKIHGKQGGFASNKEPFITISHLNSLEAEAYIYERDVLKIRVDDLASVIIPSEEKEKIYKGSVALIDPAEFEVGGKTYYRTVVLFENTDGLAQPGETAQIIIKTAAAENVIMVPQYSVYQKDGASYVLVAQDGATAEKKVDIGLTGSDGFIEIMRGIFEGERVVTRPALPNTTAQ